MKFLTNTSEEAETMKVNYLLHDAKALSAKLYDKLATIEAQNALDMELDHILVLEAVTLCTQLNLKMTTYAANTAEEVRARLMALTPDQQELVYNLAKESKDKKDLLDAGYNTSRFSVRTEYQRVEHQNIVHVTSVYITRATGKQVCIIDRMEHKVYPTCNVDEPWSTNLTRYRKI
jgi:hypothetical protein